MCKPSRKTVVKCIFYRRFLEFVSRLNPKFNCPSEKTIRTRLIPDIFSKINSRVKCLLETHVTDYASLTTDLWTSCSHDSYISLTLHFLDESFNQKMAVLSCMSFEADHDAENVLAKIEEKLNEFSSRQEKIHLFVRDNAANMVAAFNLSSYNHVGCFLHILQVS